MNSKAAVDDGGGGGGGGAVSNDFPAAAAAAAAASPPHQPHRPHHDRTQQQQQQQRLPAAELVGYGAWFTCVLIGSGFAFRSQVSVRSLEELDATTLQEGLFGFKMDNTYLDWNHFLKSFASLLGCLAAHHLVSQFSRRFFSLQLHHLACSAFTLLTSCWLLSPRCAALLVGLHLGCYLAGSSGHAAPVWAVALVAFLRFNGAAFGAELRTGLGLDARGAHLFYPISGYLYCRFLSMGLCLAAASGGGGGDGDSYSRLRGLMQRLPASLHYTFYLPMFFGGPVVTMDDFVAQVTAAATPCSRAADSSKRSGVRTPGWRGLAWRAARLVLWLAVTQAIVHSFPVGAYLETIGLRLAHRREPIRFGQVAFAMYTRGQLFMLEYVQYYGWPALFAAADGAQLPHWPACICRVTSYREMWRLFDRGLFSIVHRHVYIPMGGSRRGLARQLAATAASFGFICLYHGNYDSVQAWILLNLALVVMELLAVRLYYRGGLEAAMLRWLSPRSLRRLTGGLAAANLIPPSVGIFYFFYGTYAGKLLAGELLWKPLTGQSSLASFAIFYSAVYCSVQLAIEYKLRGGGGDTNKD